MNLEKDKYELIEDQMLDYLIEKEELDGDPAKNVLVPAGLQKAKLKKDLRENARLLDLNLDLVPALQILRNEVASYLDALKHQEMVEQLTKIPMYLEQLDFSKASADKLSVRLHISESTLQSIYKVAVSKFDEDNLDGALSIFGLLATLDHENEDRLLQLGVIASKMEKWELARKAYDYALFLNPTLLETRIFSAENYQKLGHNDRAREEIVEAQKLIETTNPESLWLELFESIKTLIHLR